MRQDEQLVRRPDYDFEFAAAHLCKMLGHGTSIVVILTVLLFFEDVSKFLNVRHLEFRNRFRKAQILGSAIQKGQRGAGRAEREQVFILIPVKQCSGVPFPFSMSLALKLKRNLR